jgi:hypothetical protein
MKDNRYLALGCQALAGSDLADRITAGCRRGAAPARACVPRTSRRALKAIV